jgi:broad specificity phosphatase PhoE
VLVVAHGGTIKTLLGHLRDQPLAAALSEQPFDNCGLATVDVAAPDSPADDAVVAANETGFLDADPDPGADLTLDRDG